MRVHQSNSADRAAFRNRLAARGKVRITKAIKWGVCTFDRLERLHATPRFQKQLLDYSRSEAPISGDTARQLLTQQRRHPALAAGRRPRTHGAAGAAGRGVIASSARFR